MKVAIGCDHRGIEQKKSMAEAISAAGHEVQDMGTHSTDSCDYPDFAEKVARAVSTGDADRGILTCGTGIGVSLAANKIKGVLAAVAHDERTALLSRQHNNANVLCLPGDTLDQDQIRHLVTIWLKEDFEGGRHERRVNKILALEN